MSILSSLYDIRKINNGFLWSTMFVLTSIPIINLYDKKTIYWGGYAHHHRLYNTATRIKTLP